MTSHNTPPPTFFFPFLLSLSPFPPICAVVAACAMVGHTINHAHVSRALVSWSCNVCLFYFIVFWLNALGCCRTKQQGSGFCWWKITTLTSRCVLEIQKKNAVASCCYPCVCLEKPVFACNTDPPSFAFCLWYCMCAVSTRLHSGSCVGLGLEMWILQPMGTKRLRRFKSNPTIWSSWTARYNN